MNKVAENIEKKYKEPVDEYYRYENCPVKIERDVNGFQAKFPVGYGYNGGTVIGGKWYKGYKIPYPKIPDGWELHDIRVGLQLYAEPPYATQLLVPNTVKPYSKEYYNIVETTKTRKMQEKLNQLNGSKLIPKS